MNDDYDYLLAKFPVSLRHSGLSGLRSFRIYGELFRAQEPAADHTLVCAYLLTIILIFVGEHMLLFEVVQYTPYLIFCFAF
jgi:hypothetical protein